MTPAPGFPSKLTRLHACHRCGATVSPEVYVCAGCGLPLEDESPSPDGEHTFLARHASRAPLAIMVLGMALVVGAPLVLDGPVFQAPEAIASVRGIGWVFLALGVVLSLMGRTLYRDR